jgi:glycosyltransferase involved in cell wall biosynthesis
MVAISVVLPCYNRDYGLQAVLAAYEAQETQEDFELIAIDDASTDATYQLLVSYQPKRFVLRVVRQKQNKGPAAARNRAIALATAPLIVFVGDDILPGSNFIQQHFDAHCCHPELHVAILGRVAWADDILRNTLMDHIDGVGAQQFSYYYFKDGAEYDFRHFYTSNVSLKRAFLLSLDHWFDDDFPYPAFEDAELGFRLAQRGLRIIYKEAILVRHVHYHTIWSFSMRQYNCGKMAWLVTRKHLTGVGRVLFKQYFRILSLLWRPTTIWRTLSAEMISQLENRALHLASSYEWTPANRLDEFYIQILDYFYYKGLMDGILGNSFLVQRLHGAHAQQVLVPLIQTFSPIM